MRKIILLSVFLLTAVSVFAQSPTWSWITSPQLTGSIYARTVLTDPQGNVYVNYGTYSNITFWNQDFIVDPQVGQWFFVKYSSEGNIISVIPGIRTGLSITMDEEGNIYTAGPFVGTLALGNITLTSADEFETGMFVAKYDNQGNILWARQADATGEEYFMQSNDIVVDPTGNVYVSGHMAGSSATFDNITLTTGGEYDAYIAKYDTNGIIQWVRNGAGHSNLGLKCNLACDSSGNIYMASNFDEGDMTFGDIVLANSGSPSSYVVKYDSEGNVVWAKKQGGNDSTVAWDIAIDNSDNIYMTGNFKGSSTFGDIVLNNPNGNNTEGFIAKFNSGGTTVWAKSFGGTDYDYGTSLSVESNGTVYLSGTYRSPQLTLGEIVLYNTGVVNSFMTKIDTNGSYVWAKRIINSDLTTTSGDITVNQQDTAVYLLGPYSGSVTLDGTTFTTPTNNIYLAKISLGDLGSSDFKNTTLGLYPNPAKDILNINNESALGQKYTITDMTGRTIKSGIVENTIDVSSLSSGLYTFTTDSKSAKFIKE